MSESNYIPDGTGVVMGDRKPMPDRGTSVGFTGYNVEDDGKSLDLEATNTMGGISDATGSDPADDCHNAEPNLPVKGKGEGY